jgi:hypothetical protein
VVLDDPSVSRRHALLTVSGRITVEDLGSTNGTAIQGRKLAPGEKGVLALGTVFEVGSATLVLQRTTALGGRAHRTPTDMPGTVVRDPTMKRLYEMLDVVAPTGLSVLILGETGVGKEVFAEALHRLSSRVGAPFLKLNCAALPESILEAELFGYEKGAFTGATQTKVGLFEAADGGTLFLDEVGEMAPSTQTKVLRALESGEVMRLGSSATRKVDVRFISAANRDLRKLVASGGFRADLFFRLNGITMTLPPLRKRPEDVLPLAEVFLARSARKLAKPAPRLGEEARKALGSHPWPGNVRELRNVIERAGRPLSGRDPDAGGPPASRGGDRDSGGAGAGVVGHTAPGAARGRAGDDASAAPAGVTRAEGKAGGVRARADPRGAGEDHREPDAGGEAARHRPAHADQEDGPLRHRAARGPMVGAPSPTTPGTSGISVRASVRCSRKARPLEGHHRGKDMKLFLHATVGCGGGLLRTAAVLPRAQVGRVPVPPVMLDVRILEAAVVFRRLVEEVGEGCHVRGSSSRRFPLAAGKPRPDLLDQPGVPVRILERGE